MSSVLQYFEIALAICGALILASFMLLLMGVRANRQIPPGRFWQCIGFIVLLLFILLLMAYSYF